MAKTTNEDLIAKLTADLSPVKSHWSAEKRMVVWVVLSLCFVLGGLWYIQPLTDMSLKRLESYHILTEFTLLMIPFGVCGFLALLAGVPGRIPKKRDLFLAILPLLAFIGFIFYQKFTGSYADAEYMGYRFYCSKEVAYFSMVPMMLMLVFVLRSYVFRAFSVAIFVAVGGVALSLAIMQISCVGDPDHTLNYHILPVIPVFLGGMVISALLIRKIAKS